MAITFELDAAKLVEGVNAKKAVACDLSVNLLRRPTPTAAPLPGRPRLHLPLAVAPIVSTPPAPPATSLAPAAPALRLGLAPLLAPPVPLAPPAPGEVKEAKADPTDASVPAEPASAPFVGVVGTVLFGVYAILRLVVVRDRTRTDQVLATAAAVATALTFLASATFSSAGRSLVDALTGTALGVTTLADVAAVTGGFEAVPIIASVDQPVALGIVAIFFLWRRAMSEVPTEKHEHRDLEHQPIKETVWLLVVVSYFTIVPAFDLALGAATVVLTLQVVASGLLLFGLVPGSNISPHTITLTAATLSAVAREVALSS
tara:strand:- start:849 stop:1799 length:951 start_codon:yes stop_codon:yes gene_type:complete